ncbi:MAG TPA: 50S ribosomal protein L11 methyltransferase [Gammaproteobacteria bacterium]
MAWHELELTVSSTDLAEAEALLGLVGAEAVSLSGASSTEILEPAPGEAPVWPTVTVRALFSSEQRARAVAAAIPGHLRTAESPQFREVSHTDWSGGWPRLPAARDVGDRLTLLPADAGEPPPGRTPVRLRMGLAFGTGEHPTTRMCLEWLDSSLSPAATILDYGCGSGVLAIAALKLGASRAWAVDVEPQALTATNDNAQLNAVSDRLWAGLPEQLPEIRVDVLVANILSGPLAGLVDRLASLVMPGGDLVLSGMLTDQAVPLRAAYSRYFDDFGETRLGRWTTLFAVRR